MRNHVKWKATTLFAVEPCHHFISAKLFDCQPYVYSDLCPLVLSWWNSGGSANLKLAGQLGDF